MIDDRELLTAWSTGDTQAGNALFVRHIRALCRFFRGKAPDEDMEDLVQRTLLNCVASIDRFRRDATFRGYLFAIARNELYAFHTRRKPKRDRLDFGVSSIVNLDPSPATLLAARAEEVLLLQALRRIPIDMQIALELHYYEGMGGSEIAEALDVPEGTIRSRLRRGRELLEARMNELADSGKLVQDTVDNLERWATELRNRDDDGRSAR